MTKVPEAGYKIIGLWVDGFQEKVHPEKSSFSS